MIDGASVDHGQHHVWTVSKVLKRAREGLGLSLVDVATVLRIRLVQLQAIEEGRFNELPGTVYAIGFVRSYADFLGLESDRVVEMFRDEVAVQKDPPELIFPSPLPESGVPGGALIMLAIVLAVVAYAGWYYVASPNRDFADLVPGLPDRFVALIDGERTGGDTGPGEAAVEETRQARLRPGNAAGPADGNADGPAVDDVDASAGAGPSARLSADVAAVPTDTAAEGLAVGPVRTDPDDAAAPDRGEQVIDAFDGRFAAPVTAEPGLMRPDRIDPVGFDEPTRRTHDATTAEAATPAEIVPTPPASSFVGLSEAEPGTLRAGDGRQQATIASFAAFDDLPLPPPPTSDEDGQSSTQSRPAAGAEEPQIIIRAVADSWVQVNDSDGSLVMTRMLRPGDRYEVPESSGLRLVTGNAGGLEIIVDGQSVPALGGSGVVLRNVPLDASRLRSGTATPN